MSTWIGLQVVNRHSAARIKNISAATGKGMTDDLAFEALANAVATATFKTKGARFGMAGRQLTGGRRPVVLQWNQATPVNRRSLEQLRRSRTKVTSPTGVPTLPDSVAGVPIVVTDSIVNAEA